jgi:hypothetical protein
MVAAMMELEVRHGPSRAADRLAVHPADKAHKRSRVWKGSQDVIPLVSDLWPVDLHEADIVRSGFKTEFA